MPFWEKALINSSAVILPQASAMRAQTCGNGSGGIPLVEHGIADVGLPGR